MEEYIPLKPTCAKWDMRPMLYTGICKCAATTNLMEKMAAKIRSSTITFEKGFFKGFMMLAGIVFLVVLFIYMLTAILLLMGHISLWNVRDFLLFTGIGTVVGLGFIFRKALSKGKKNRAAEGRSKVPLAVIKYFDNDELTFAKAKSRLFVE